MIGRGTRNHEACRYHDRLPSGQKTEFLIIDFWQNDFGKQTDEGVSPEIPVLVRLFNTRLDLLAATLNNREDFAHKQARLDCRIMLDRIPQDSFPVRKVWGEIDEAWSPNRCLAPCPRAASPSGAGHPPMELANPEALIPTP